MKRPEGMPFDAYKEALRRLNRRIADHAKGEIHREMFRWKPIPWAIHQLFN